jgi:hypothetical protein
MFEPGTAERARIWFAKAEETLKLTTGIMNYIGDLKTELSKEKWLPDSMPNQLLNQLIHYRRDLMLIDPIIDAQLEKTIMIITPSFDSLLYHPKDFSRKFFNNLSMEATQAMLTKFQNNIKIAENNVITFCYEKVGRTDGDGYFTAYETIVAQSSSYVGPGETIDITAGLATITRGQKPEVIMNQKKIPLNESGLAVYSLHASHKPGKYEIPVDISYHNEDGKKITRTYHVEYTVAGTVSKHN